MFRSMNPEYYILERTSACSGPENISGFGWALEYRNEEDTMLFILPDNVAESWCEEILTHIKQQKEKRRLRELVKLPSGSTS